MPNDIPENFESAKRSFNLVKEGVDDFVKEKEATVDPVRFFDQVNVEVSRIHAELENLEQRKTVLLGKEKLSEDEMAELNLLLEIAREVKDLDDLVLDYKDDYNLSAEKIVEGGNIALMIQEKERFGFSIPFIFESMKAGFVHYREGSKIFESIGNLNFTNDDLQKLAEAGQGFGGMNIMLVLRYGKISAEQKEFLYKQMVKIKFVDNSVGIAICLASLDIPKKYRAILIADIEQFAEVMNKLLGMDSLEGIYELGGNKDFGEMALEISGHLDGGQPQTFLFQNDLLASTSLSLLEKQKIAGAMAKLATGTDAKFLLQNYGRYFDKGSKALLEKSIQTDPLGKNLHIPTLYDLDENALKGKKVKIVVHPLFGARVQPGFDGFQEGMVEMMQNAMKYFRGKEVPREYFEVMYALRQVEELKKDLEDKDSFVILAFPRDDWKDPYINNGKYQFFDALTKGKTNVAYIETGTNNSGDLKPWDMRLLDQRIDENADVETMGGYIGRCLASGIESFIGMKGKRRVSIDYEASAPAMDWGYRLQMSGEFFEKTVENFGDVIEMIERNAQFNAKVDAQVIKDRTESESKNPLNVDFYINHNKR